MMQICFEIEVFFRQFSRVSVEVDKNIYRKIANELKIGPATLHPKLFTIDASKTVYQHETVQERVRNNLVILSIGWIETDIDNYPNDNEV